MTRFSDRREAGRTLGAILAPYKSVQPTILALPRGGVPVGYEIARSLDAPLDIFVVRKPGGPGDEAPAMGAPISGRTVIVVDEGMATGASMLLAVQALRRLGPRQIVVAVPVASRESLAMLRGHVDDWACVIAPDDFQAVSQWYVDFRQVSDDEVRILLDRAARHLWLDEQPVLFGAW